MKDTMPPSVKRFIPTNACIMQFCVVCKMRSTNTYTAILDLINAIIIYITHSSGYQWLSDFIIYLQAAIQSLPQNQRTGNQS